MPALQYNAIDKAFEYFDYTLKRVLDATSGLTDAQWHFKPAPDRSSIAENLEHLAIVQDRVLGPVREQIAQAPAPPAGRDAEGVDAIILEMIPDRSVRAKVPDHLNPTGRWTPAEALARLSRNYERLSDWVGSTPDLREHWLEAPPLRIVTNGTHTMMDGYQWALTLAAHDERHVRQIEEVKADPHYPRAA